MDITLRWFSEMAFISCTHFSILPKLLANFVSFILSVETSNVNGDSMSSFACYILQKLRYKVE